MKVKDFILKNQAKILLNSIDGGSLVYLPTKGKVNLITNKHLDLNSNSFYFKYYKKVFDLPEIELNKLEELKKHVTNLVLFDEFSAGDKKFYEILKTSGLSIKYDSALLNNKYFFQKMVSKLLGPNYSTNPIIIGGGADLVDCIKAVKNFLEIHKKIVVKISDEFIAGMGADQILIAENLDDFINFVNQQFHSSENGSIKLTKNKKLLYDLILESFTPHVCSPSITFYLHETGPEFLSINEQVLLKGGFLGSTSLLAPISLNNKNKLIQLSAKLAGYAHQTGARGFIGFDTVVTSKNEIIFVEANYRTTASTVPKITVDKATHFSEDYDWFYFSSFYYNKKVKNVSEMINVLKNFGVLFEKNKDKKINCIITFGEREKRCGLCFFWKKDSLSLEIINFSLNKVLTGISANINPDLKIGL